MILHILFEKLSKKTTCILFVVIDFYVLEKNPEVMGGHQFPGKGVPFADFTDKLIKQQDNLTRHRIYKLPFKHLKVEET